MGARRRASRSTDLTLAPQWREWIADNLARGVDRRAVSDVLVSRGVPRREVDARIAEIESSAALVVARRAIRRIKQLDLVLEVGRRADALGSSPAEVERVAGVDAETFFERYYVVNRPVVITDLTRGWPALRRWKPSYFVKRFGDVDVEVAIGREADPDYDMHTKQLSRTMTMREAVERIVAAGESNDLYLVANNRNIDRDALAALYRDIRLPKDILDVTKLRGGAALWLGPKGTVTPLHHDTSNILFSQIHGRKRFLLAPPRDVALLDGARGVYAGFDPEKPDAKRFPAAAKVAFRSVELAPGDALFIPVGWWHHVRALDLSISLAFVCFRRPNAFTWYRPGDVR
ncbi:MAG: cupin-like domain-containing protein [Deltaproteobacteria bacterium]|nr:cupin-like domain-containing protein [Deltaproteobacteria bacterium]